MTSTEILEVMGYILAVAQRITPVLLKTMENVQDPDLNRPLRDFLPEGPALKDRLETVQEALQEEERKRGLR